MDKKKQNWFKRHKILTGILCFLILFIAIGSLGSSADKNKTADSKKPAASKAKAAPTLAKVGETAPDGKFEFVVNKVKCGEPSVTDSTGYVSKTAQGQYCLLDLTVKNIGDKQQYFSQGDQKLLNAAGQQYSPDTLATLYNSNNKDVFGAQLNPGNSVQGIIVFDIPKDQTMATAELHDSSLSNGVKVALQ